MPGKPLLSKPVIAGGPAECSGVPTTRLAHYPNALAIGSQVEEYRIDRVLGAGGFGITYRAVDLQLRTHVAVKEYFPMPYASRAHDGMTVVPSIRGHELSSQAPLSNYELGAERYLEEARLLARIRHPNVVRVSRYFGANGSAYIVMDYEEGQVLSEILAGRRTLPESRIIGLLRQLLPALEAVHEEGFLHRDIKPDNLLVRSKDESLVLIDFGAARRTFEKLSYQVTCLVTPGYSPPEQYASNPVRYGPRTDIYSLGAVLYRCISGIVPPTAAERLIEDEMPGPAEVAESEYSAGLLEVISRALTLQPQDRFQDVAEIREILGVDTAWSASGAPTSLSERKRPVGPGSSKSFGAVASDRLLPLGGNLLSVFRSGWRGHKLVIAAVCLLIFCTALPILWQTALNQGPWTEPEQVPGEKSLEAPDLSTLELFAPVAPVVTPTELVIAGDDQSNADDSNADEAVIVVATLGNTAEAAAPADNDERIPELLELARESLDEFRLSTPPRHNAYYYFDQILEIDPNHTDARRGYVQIAARYSELAKKEFQRGNRNRANRYVKLGLGFDPDNAELLGLRQDRVVETSTQSGSSSPSSSENGAKALFSNVKRFLAKDLPSASSGEQKDLGMETANR